MKNKERGKRTVQASSWLIPVTWAHRGAGDSPGFTRPGVKPQPASPLKHEERGRDLVGSEVSDAVCKKHLARGGGSRNAGGAGAGRHLECWRGSVCPENSLGPLEGRPAAFPGFCSGPASSQRNPGKCFCLGLTVWMKLNFSRTRTHRLPWGPQPPHEGWRVRLAFPARSLHCYLVWFPFAPLLAWGLF